MVRFLPLQEKNGSGTALRARRAAPATQRGARAARVFPLQSIGGPLL
jgi:hypothetical protein